jgi:UDP-N-acetylglucosamine transferase subunit ALG13
MIPLAKKFIDLGHNVFIGSGSEHLEFFRKELPEINCISFSGFSLRYSSWLPQYIVILLNSPALFWSILKEHRKLRKVIAEYGIDIVVSDSRPGLWNRSVKTVFVTHMIKVPLPRWASFIEKTGLFSTKRIIRKFNFCFIPDLPKGNDLSGKLSHDLKLPANARYIGILSRVPVRYSPPPRCDYSIFCTVILSGPEPQRGMMKQMMTQLLKQKGGRSVILEGRPAAISGKRTDGNITYYSHVSAAEMIELIAGSRYIVSRSGYTTLMELASLGRSALIIPTPGQTEQEYLADYLAEKGWFSAISQCMLQTYNFPDEMGSEIPRDLASESEKLLDCTLSELLEDQHK